MLGLLAALHQRRKSRLGIGPRLRRQGLRRRRARHRPRRGASVSTRASTPTLGLDGASGLSRREGARWAALRPARALATSSPGPVKELALYLSFLLAEDPATLEALAAAQQPAGQLASRRSTSPTALQAAMNAFLAAGETLLRTTSLADCSLGERIKQPHHRTAHAQEGDGPSTAACRPQCDRAARLLRVLAWRSREPRLRRPAAGAALDGLDAPEAPFTYRRLDRLVRALRRLPRPTLLDPRAQPRLPRLATRRAAVPRAPRALAGASALAGLDDETTLRAQRLLLATPDAPLDLGARAVLGIRASIADDAQPSSIAAGGGARAASSRGIVVAALGRRSRRLRLCAHERLAIAGTRLRLGRAHALAPARGAREATRLFADPFEAPETIAAMLPTHATHVFCCTECRRIVNILRTVRARTSASTRSGLGLDAAHRRRRVWRSAHAVCEALVGCAAHGVALKRRRARSRSRTPDARAHRPAPRDLRPATIAELPTRQGCGHTGHCKDAARHQELHRPEPRATACGDVPLVRIPILGRAIRLFGDLRTLHAVRVLGQDQPRRASRRAVLHALRFFDAVRQGARNADPRDAAEAAAQELPVLRTAGVDGDGSKFKVVFAPMDDTESNAHVPPPLRTCSYCPLHYRTWLHNSQRELPTNVVLSHISARARPMFGGGRREARRCRDWLENTAGRKRRSRRRSAVAKGRRSFRR